jgi:hypothetical protein
MANHCLVSYVFYFNTLIIKVVFFLFFKYFFGVPCSATFIFDIFVYVIASIAYIHPVYGVRIQTHDLLIMSRLR